MLRAFFIAVLGNIGTSRASRACGMRAVGVNQPGWLATAAGRGLSGLPDRCANVKFNWYIFGPGSFCRRNGRFNRKGNAHDAVLAGLRRNDFQAAVMGLDDFPAHG